MSSDFRGASVGRGGAGPGGGRGGDIGSYNYSGTNHANSHNDNSLHHRVDGDNYASPVDKGDQYNGTISHSAVGGRGNSNQITNNDSSEQGDQKLSDREIEAIERLKQARAKVAAKKERERIKRLEDEVKQLERELEEE
ncbi:hypothetical protein GALMADRAFT_158439 [Galerina marginata CBS 339.88]|uniref:Uncharacterized protein n=1 Tax=Galerina marginata (strain CBS 339.88) TaxID=685588 RepID=A0A067T2Y6_GALM3|nr:hypothetical protein GALMADRAFT_158439 [Galerina marginata CBS 339.88]